MINLYLIYTVNKIFLHLITFFMYLKTIVRPTLKALFISYTFLFFCIYVCLLNVKWNIPGSIEMFS